MTLAPELLSLLACPEDKGPLYYLEDLDVLYNPRLLRACTSVRDGIPIMLIDEAQRLEPVRASDSGRSLQAENVRTDVHHTDDQHGDTIPHDQHVRGRARTIASPTCRLPRSVARR